MTPTFSVRNFEKFQHYKDRAPPWIKLYNDLLDDYEFSCLQDASKLHLVMIWLLASRSDNKIPYDAAWISKRINASDPIDLDGLAKVGFIVLNQPLPIVEHVASTLIAERLPRERGEGETETEGETEIHAPDDIVSQAKDAIGYLNVRCSRSFQSNDTSLRHPIARLRAGMTLDELKRVVDFKASQWLHDPTQHEYLRPQTLFGTKADAYLQAATAAPTINGKHNGQRRDERNATERDIADLLGR